VKKLAILAAATGLIAAANAQTTGLETQISVRAGIQFPTTADLDGSFYGFGVDFNLPGQASLFRNATTYFSVDWISKNLKFNRNFIIPICINQRFRLNSPSETMTSPQTYAFVGVGAAIIDIGGASTQLCGRAGLGADFNSNVFGEAAFVITGRAKTTNVQGNHIGVWLGYKF
jgi:hypothetical protein